MKTAQKILHRSAATLAAVALGLFATISGLGLYWTIKEAFLDDPEGPLSRFFIKMPAKIPFIPTLMSTFIASIFNLVIAALIYIPHNLIKKPLIDVMLNNKSIKQSFWPNHPGKSEIKSPFYRYFITTVAQLSFVLVLGLSILSVGTALSATIWASPVGIPLIGSAFGFMAGKMSLLNASLTLTASALVTVPFISAIVAGFRSFGHKELNATPSPAKPQGHKLIEEQENNRKVFIESFQKTPRIERTSVATHAVTTFHNKVSDYENDFKSKCEPLKEDENLEIKNAYMQFNNEIEQANEYLNALKEPAESLDMAASTNADLSILRKKAQLIILRCAPDRNTQKGKLVEVLSHEFMKMMLSYKNKLLNGQDETDPLGIRPYNQRFNDMALQVRGIVDIRDALWREEKADLPHSTAIVASFDEKRIMTLLDEFRVYLRTKSKRKEISFRESEDIIGIFSFYCFALRESLRTAIDEITTLTTLSKVRTRAHNAEAKLQASLRETINSLFNQSNTLISQGKLKASEPAIIRLFELNTSPEVSYEDLMEIVKALQDLCNENGISLLESQTPVSGHTSRRLSFQGYAPTTSQPECPPPVIVSSMSFAHK